MPEQKNPQDNITENSFPRQGDSAQKNQEVLTSENGNNADKLSKTPQSTQPAQSAAPAVQGQGQPRQQTHRAPRPAQQQPQAGQVGQPRQQTHRAPHTPAANPAATANQPAQPQANKASAAAPAMPATPATHNQRTHRPPAAPANQAATAAPSTELAVADAPPRKPQNNRPRRSSASKKSNSPAPLRIISLGGLGEIGKNMTLIEYGNDIIIIDVGLAFPDDDMPGIDLVIPDFSYVLRNKDRVRGIVLTHGHEDHIGSLSYLLKELDTPVYSARLTIGLVEGKLKEAGILKKSKLNVIKAGDTIKLGCMSVEFIPVNHSIPDAMALAIFTPVGTLVHTGDFKIDYTPVDSVMINLPRFGELGSKGVLALMCDSTNAERPGVTPSERKVGESFDILFKKAGAKRIIIASFSSNVHRIQQIIDVAVKHDRKVVISGRSMENVTAKAAELGYLKFPPNTLVDIDKMRSIPDEQLVIITTGSQGEPMSALTRMARGEHKKIMVTAFDFIIISATPIPGNEKLVGRVINDLMRLGADVIYESTAGIHVSGHACREDIKTILSLTRPKYFIPVHGEFKHMAKSRDIAVEMGMSPENVVLSDIGRVIELTPDSIKMTTTVPSGAIMVDGSGIGDVGSVVLRDRKLLAEDGLIIAVVTIDKKTGEILSGPDVVSRGFVYVRESEELLGEARKICHQAVSGACDASAAAKDWNGLKMALKDQLGSFLYSKTRRRPMILPIIQEVTR